MTVKAKTLVKDKFWIVEQNGEKLGTLQKKDNNGWIFLSKADQRQVYHTQESLFQKFGVEQRFLPTSLGHMYPSGEGSHNFLFANLQTNKDRCLARLHRIEQMTFL